MENDKDNKEYNELLEIAQKGIATWVDIEGIGSQKQLSTESSTLTPTKKKNVKVRFFRLLQSVKLKTVLKLE